jgi:hypothetical protein
MGKTDNTDLLDQMVKLLIKSLSINLIEGNQRYLPEPEVSTDDNTFPIIPTPERPVDKKVK